MKKFPAFTFLLFSAIVIWICLSSHSSSPEQPLKIIFDTDMGSDCDDAGALALLHQYANQNKAQIVGCMYSSEKVPYGAGIVEAINIAYGRPDIPVGASHGNIVGDPVDKMEAEKLAKDTAAFGNTIIHNQDAPEQTRLCRKLLVAQPDRSVTYITVGHTKGLYDLLISKADDLSPLNGRELIQKKVSRWVALGALGAYNDQLEHRKDWNFFFNGTATYTKYLVEHFPAPVYYISAGSDVMTGKGLKQKPSGHIVRTVYRDWLWNYEKKTLDDQRPSWDLAAVYFAVEGLGPFLVNEGAGKLVFDEEKGCRWKPGKATPEQHYISQKAGVSKPFADYLNEMLSR